MSHAGTSLDQALNNRRRQQEEVVNVDEPMTQLVVFSLAGQRFALPGENVTEILGGDQSVYLVPGMPASVEGVINLRGEIESVITLYSLLQLTFPDTDLPGPAPPGSVAAGMILMAQTEGMRSGLRIEQLEDVCDVPKSVLKPPPAALPSHLRPYVTGLWEQEQTQQAVAVLNLNALFRDYRQGLG
ncbi:chemotaxis protein CheW [Vreelandella rituensis]|uniref:Chemotaxis protein CheW n=1 Tax=Vreelandella rituensis TaxID=2282306 RepID=A0A368TXX4_9GAMM|nr:chemotaxis protein CheW [Halomonas rituensis]RCV89625.1 chemotaxis protein CheW [Halomonas rituensis]